MLVFTVLSTPILCVVIIFLILKNSKQKIEIEIMHSKLERADLANEQYLNNIAELSKVKKDLQTEKSRNKSVEVRTGQIMETMAPFMEVFNHNPKNAHFLGSPIDYIVFNDDEIVFLEVKTGKARTTPKQNNIKKLIKEGKVSFELVRFDYE